MEEPTPVLKSLKEQLTEKVLNSSLSSDESDDNLFVSNKQSKNDIFSSHNENDSRKSNSKMAQMRLNIKLHRHRLLQLLQNSDDNVIKPKIKNIILNDAIKSNTKHNVKQKLASSANLVKPELKPINAITNHETISTVQIVQPKPVITNEIRDPQVLTYAGLQKHSLSIFTPVSKIKMKKSTPRIVMEGPTPRIEMEKPTPVLKSLKEQLIEEVLNSSSSSDESDDYLFVGNKYSKNDLFSSHNENNSRKSNSIEAVKYYKHEQPINNKSKNKYSCNSSKSNSNINYPTTSKKSQTRNMVVKHQSTNSKSKRSLKRKDSIVRERASRSHLSKSFNLLRKCCCYLESNKRVPKMSILLAAKRECNLLRNFQKQLLIKKQVLLETNKNLEIKLAKLKY